MAEEIVEKCRLCGTKVTVFRKALQADQYQAVIGVKEDSRTWYTCRFCELYSQTNCLTDEQVKQSYLRYRDAEIRSEDVETTFNTLVNLPEDERENEVRWGMFCTEIQNQAVNITDIGSGIGIWPMSLVESGFPNVKCIEPEPNSAKFINTKLNIPCHSGFYEPGLYDKADVVTLIHVLEHMRDPLSFLRSIKANDLVLGGLLFLEVPDPVAISHLVNNIGDHDDFNSLHFWSFSVMALERMLRMAKFRPFVTRRVHYEKRNLYRIIMLCESLDPEGPGYRAKGHKGRYKKASRVR
ncbi:MAG: class I SAM-dependent methyltransferase [Chloroflexota bacterium]|nr:class I SAM-dependent methyltransferase [Chloroflexota bacterium]